MLDLKILFVALAWHDQTYVECGVQLQQKNFISRGSQRKAWNVTVTNFCYFRISYSWWTAALLASQNTEFPKYTIALLWFLWVLEFPRFSFVLCVVCQRVHMSVSCCQSIKYTHFHSVLSVKGAGGSHLTCNYREFWQWA